MAEVLHACCLLPDLLQWMHGLETEIGERGILIVRYIIDETADCPVHQA